MFRSVNLGKISYQKNENKYTKSKSKNSFQNLLRTSTCALALLTLPDLVNAADKPSVFNIAFSSSFSSPVQGTLVDGLELSDFQSPLITDTGAVVFGSTGRYFVSSGNSIQTITDLDGTPIPNFTLTQPGLPQAFSVDQQTGAVFLGDGTTGRYIEGNTNNPGEFTGLINIGAQTGLREIRAQNGAIAVVDDDQILFRANTNGATLDPYLISATSNTNVTGGPTDIKFAGDDLLLGSFTFNAGGTNEQAFALRDTDGNLLTQVGPDFNIGSDQVYNGLTIPDGQFNTSSSLDQGSSNGERIAFTIPVALTPGGNFGVALVVRNINHTDATLTNTDGTTIVFDTFTDPTQGIDIAITSTTIGDMVFRADGTQFEAEINPTVAANGDVIFFARGTPPGTNDTTTGYWRLRASDGMVEPVLIDGMNITGITDFGTVGTATVDFDSDAPFGSRLAIESRLTINQDGRVALVGRVNIAGQANPVTALIGQNSDGDFFVVAHEGQVIDLGAEGGTRTVSIANNPSVVENVVFVSGGVNGNEFINSNDLDGVSDGFNINSQLAFVVNFDDGSQGLFRADLGAGEAPEIELFRWSGGCGTTEWGTRCTLGGQNASNWVNQNDTSQISEDPAGENSGIARVLIEDADVTISASDVSITSLDTSNSTLTVSESLTVAEGANVDKLSVSGTVTSGNSAFNAKQITLDGGTLSGNSDYIITGDVTTVDPLLIVNPSENNDPSTLDSNLILTNGDADIKATAELHINDGIDLSITGGDIILRDDASISGTGNIIVGENSELKTDFNSGSSSATVAAPVTLNQAHIFAASGTLTVNELTINNPEITLEPSILAVNNARLILNGDTTISAGSNLTNIEGRSSGSDMGTQIQFQNNTFNINDAFVVLETEQTVSPGAPTNLQQAMDLNTIVGFNNSTVSGTGQISFNTTTRFEDSTVNARLRGAKELSVLQLVGNNSFSAGTPPANETGFEFSGATIAQSDGNTVFSGAAPLTFKGSNARNQVFVGSGELTFANDTITIGTENNPETGPVMLINPTGTGLVSFGSTDVAGRTTLKFAGLDFGVENQEPNGGARIEDVNFTALAAESESIITNHLNTVLRGTFASSNSLTLADVTAQQDIRVDNNGSLILNDLDGTNKISLNNYDQTLLQTNWENIGTLTNAEDSLLRLSSSVTELRGTLLKHYGLLEIPDNADVYLNINIEGRPELDGPASAQFKLGNNALLTIDNSDLIPIERFAEDNLNNDGVSLGGHWDLDDNAEVSIGSRASIEQIGVGATVKLDAGAKINDLNETGGELRVLEGQLTLPGSFDTKAALIVGNINDANALLSADNLFVNGNLDHFSGEIDLQEENGGIITADAISSNGNLSATRITANQVTIREGANWTITDDRIDPANSRINVTTDLDISGTLQFIGETPVEASLPENIGFGSVSANNVFVDTSGQLSLNKMTAANLVTNNGTLSASTIETKDYNSAAGSNLTVRNLVATDNVVLAGTVNSALRGVSTGGSGLSAIQAQNITFSNNTILNDDFLIEATNSITIGKNVTTERLFTGFAPNVFVDGLIRVENLSGQAFDEPSTLRIRNGGTVQIGVPTTIFSRNTSPVDFDTIIVERGGTLTGGTFGAGISGDVVNEGSIIPGFSPGTITINGNYTQGADAVLQLELGGSEEGQFDQLVVNGTATFDENAVINIVMIDPDPDDGVDRVYRPRTGDTFNFIVTDDLNLEDGVSPTDVITFQNLPASGEFLVDFIDVDGVLTLQLEAMFGSLLAETPGLTAQQRDVALVLDAISGGATGNDDLTAFADALDQIDGQNDRATALSEAGFSFASGLMDLSYTALNSSNGYITRHIDGKIWQSLRKKTTHQGAPRISGSNGNRLLAANFADDQSLRPLRNDGAQTAGLFANLAQNENTQSNLSSQQSQDFRFFLAGGYEFGSFDASANQTGLNYNGSSAVLGSEFQITDNSYVGISANIANITGDVNSSLGNISLTQYGVSAHAVADFQPIIIDTILSIGRADIDTSRNVTTGALFTATGQTDASTYSGRLRASLPFDKSFNNGSLRFGPDVEILTQRVDIKGFTEAGHNSLALTLSDTNNSRTAVRAGFTTSAVFNQSRSSIMPYGRVSYEYELDQSAPNITTNFTGEPTQTFLTRTDNLSKSTIAVEGGVNMNITNWASLGLSYVGRFNKDARQHSIRANARIVF